MPIRVNTMARARLARSGGHGLPVTDGPTSESEEDPKSAGSGWHPGVRLILVLVVLLPVISTGIVLGSEGASAWTFRQRAQVVAKDAAQLQVAASARAQMNAL